MGITTIQLNDNVKKRLESMKSDKDSYEDVIVKLIDKVDEEKIKRNELLKEEAIEMYKDMIEINKEWEGTLMDGLDKDEKW